VDGADPDGRAVLEAAGAVRAGRADRLLHRLPVGSAAELAYAGVERIEPDRGGGLARLVDAWFEARIAAGGRFAELALLVHRFTDGAPAPQAVAELDELHALFESSRVLCATRRLPAGADALNHLFHLRAAAALGATTRGDRAELLPGEPVVVRENDYARGLYNGDAGMIVRVGDGVRAELRAVFRAGDSWRALPIDALRARLDRGYALTVHQSQGSEYDHVALVLPQTAERDRPLATRELVYTALTRARRSVVVVGAADVLRAAIARTAQRHSALRL
jgi:exodeoxyribonuclease V alpha subunit